MHDAHKHICVCAYETGSRKLLSILEWRSGTEYSGKKNIAIYCYIFIVLHQMINKMNYACINHL